MAAPRTVHRLCALQDLADNEITGLAAGLVPVCVARLGDEVFAIADACSHEGVKLSDGWLHPDRKAIECWRHGSCFSLATGAPDSPPALRPVPVFRAWVEGGQVMVEV